MRYRAKPVPVQAIQLLDISFQYKKWGGTQEAKRGDWLLSKDGEVYTCDAKVFADTYKPFPGKEGWFFKESFVEATQATEDGVVKTLSGESSYRAGDYLVRNSDEDEYCISKEKFHKLYEQCN